MCLLYRGETVCLSIVYRGRLSVCLLYREGDFMCVSIQEKSICPVSRESHRIILSVVLADSCVEFSAKFGLRACRQNL